jgi:hypothetical protein
VKVEANRTSFFGWNGSIRMNGRLRGDMRIGRSGTIVVDPQAFPTRNQGMFSRA